MGTINEQIMTLRKQLKAKLPPLRYEHSVSVSYTSLALAMRYGYDLNKAEVAGLMHDCAKCYTCRQLIEKCRKHEIALTTYELQAPAIIHARYGAWMAQHKYGIQDEEILSAICCHTTGKPNMSTLDKILYVADYIEPRRDKAENLTKLRCLAFQNLDQATYEILAATLEYLSKKGGNVDSMTQQAFAYFDEKTQNRRRRGE